MSLAMLLLMTAAASEEPIPVAPTNRPPLFFQADGGVGHGSLFGQSVTGPTGALGFGASVPRSWGSIEALVDLGYSGFSTDLGVGVHRLTLGGTGQIRLWHLRLGAGFDTGLAWIARLSSSLLPAQELFVGLHALAGVDLFTLGGVTPFVVGRADINAALPTVSASAGLRFEF